MVLNHSRHKRNTIFECLTTIKAREKEKGDDSQHEKEKGDDSQHGKALGEDEAWGKEVPSLIGVV